MEGRAPSRKTLETAATLSSVPEAGGIDTAPRARVSSASASQRAETSSRISAGPLAVDEQPAQRRHDGALEPVHRLRGPLPRRDHQRRPTGEDRPDGASDAVAHGDLGDAGGAEPGSRAFHARGDDLVDERLPAREVAIDRRARHARLGATSPMLVASGRAARARAAAATITPATRLWRAWGCSAGGIGREFTLPRCWTLMSHGSSAPSLRDCGWTVAGHGRGERSAEATPQDDEVRLGALTVQLHKGRARGPVRLQLAGELDTAVADEFQQAIEVGWAIGSGTLVSTSATWPSWT